MGLDSSGGKKTLHVLKVDDVCLDGGVGSSHGVKERQKESIGVGFRETHLNRRSPYAKRDSDEERMDVGYVEPSPKTSGENLRLKSARLALKAERRGSVCLPRPLTSPAEHTGMRKWNAAQWYNYYYEPRVTSALIIGLRVFMG